MVFLKTLEDGLEEGKIGLKIKECLEKRFKMDLKKVEGGLEDG